MKLLSFAPLALGLVCVLAFPGCGTSGPSTVSGNWSWAEDPVSGYGLVAVYHVSLNQAGGTVSGVKNIPDGTTCTITGTITGLQLQVTAAGPCSQDFTLAVSADHRSMQGSAFVSGVLSEKVTASRM